MANSKHIYAKRRKFTDIPPINNRPCTLHPDDAGVPSRPVSCSECNRIARRARFAAQGETVGSRYATARWQAEQRGHEFTLTIEQYETIVSGICVYAVGPYKGYVGIDRKNSALGYTLANSQPCCGKHNLMKSNIFSHAQALDIAQRYQIHCGALGSGRKRIVPD